MTSIHPDAILATLAWLVLTFAIPDLAAGAEAPPGSAGNDYSQRRALTGTDLEIFLDALVPTQLFRDGIAGAAVVVVNDGEVLLAKGFGYANIETREPITPSTVFRPGSISKLFTGIAVMQLVEKGKIDLDRDVNDYLNFRIETPPGGVPVTMRRLLTHRAGFEEQFKEHFATNERSRQLGVHLAEHLPPRLFPRGDVAAYSNYGMALAGYVVERLSGQPIDQYVTTEILAPLGMSQSTFQQPPPRDLQPFLSKGYPDAGRPASPFEIMPLAPAGGLSASGADIGRFMLALLDGGTLDGKRVLAADMLAEMMRPQLPAPFGLPRMGLAFMSTRLRATG
jgi:CubicO group peptidase (beta-lactamase class C family)